MAGGLPPAALGQATAPPGAVLPNPAIDVVLRLASPVSCAKGTARLNYNQVITQTTLPMAGLLVIILDIIVQVVAWCFGEDKVVRPTNFQAPDNSVTMSLPQLAEFVKGSRTSGAWEQLGQQAKRDCNATRTGIQEGPIQPLTLLVLINATATGRAGAPIFSLTVPLLSFPNITGGLPIIIVSLIDIVFERFVTSPRCHGINLPDPSNSNSGINLKPQELINLMRNFGKYFK